MADKETPQSLLEFFTVMAPAETDGQECRGERRDVVERNE